MKKIKKIDLLQFCGKVAVAVMVTAIVCLCTMSASCKIAPEGITILESDYSTPKLLNIQISNSSEIYIEFDKEIVLKQLEITSVENPEEKTLVDTSKLEKNSSFFIDCKTNFSFLENYEFFGVVEDEKYNTLTFSSVLQGFNSNVPKLAISEVRTYYQKPKLEFIEFLAQSDGNLGGMVLEVYYKTEPVEFIFPAIDVKAGDYIVLHGRKLDDTCINESSNLDEATHKDAVSGVLDFWLESESKVIGNSGVIILRERKNTKPVDALLYTEPDREYWANASVEEAAQLAIKSEVWFGSGLIEDAVMNAKPSSTRSLSRDFSKEFTGSSKDNWLFVDNGNATMGSENSLVPYAG